MAVAIDAPKKSERIDILAKIAVDPFEFLKYVKIQEPGKLAVEYQLWPHLVHFYGALKKYRLIDLIKSKQIGISWALAIHALRQIMTIPGWSVLEFSKGRDESTELLDKSRVVFNNLPEWIKEEKDYRRGSDNTEEFGFDRLGSRIVAFPSTIDAGVGRTAGMVIHDEAAFHDCFAVNLSHTRATVADSPERKLIAVSTVNSEKPENDFETHFKDAMAGKNGFQALFYGCFERPDRDEQWYEQLVRENENTPWVVAKNYPRNVDEALSPITVTSCFNEDKLKSLWADVSEGHEVRQGFIHILVPPRVGLQYVAGIDVGEGVGLDYSCLSIIGKQGFYSEVMAVIYSNTIGTDAFAFECDRLLEEYFNPKVVIDNIGIGKAVIDKMMELGTKNIYYQDNKKQKAGWALTKLNKRELAVKLIERVNNGSLVTKFKPQVKEMMEYQWIKGYPEPTGRTHGDTVITLLLACAVLDQTRSSEKAVIYRRGKRVN